MTGESTAITMRCPSCGFTDTFDAKEVGEREAEKLTDQEIARRARGLARWLVGELVPAPFVPKANVYISRFSDAKAAEASKVAMSILLTGKLPDGREV